MSRISHNIIIKAIATAAIAISALAANATTYEYITNYPGVKRLINGVYYQTGWAQIKTDSNNQIQSESYGAWIVGFDEATLPEDLVIPTEVTIYRNDSGDYHTVNVAGICDSAFYNAQNLVSVTLPNTVAVIGNYAFSDCSKLTTLTQGDIDHDFSLNKLAYIGKYIFDNCSGGEWYMGIEVNLYKSQGTIFNDDCFSCGTSVQLNIRQNAGTWYDPNVYSGLSGTNITETFEPYGSDFLEFEVAGTDDYGTEYYAVSAKTTDLPAEIVIPWVVDMAPDKPIRVVKSQAFANCTTLKTVVLNSCIESIDGSAFYNCPNIKQILMEEDLNIAEENATCDSIAIYNGALYSADKTKLIYRPANSYPTLPDELTTITSYSYPVKTTTTGSTLPASVTTIEPFGIYFAPNDSHAYTLTLGKNVRTLHDRFINRLAKNIIIEVDASNPNLAVTNGVLHTRDNSEAICYAGNTERVEIPEGIQSIRPYAFYSANNLTGVTIPASVKEVPATAFRYANPLRSISVSPKNTELTDYNSTLLGTKDGTTILFGAPYVGSATVPEGVTTIAPGAFYDANVVTLSLPSTLTEIGDSAFYRCYNIKTLTIPDNVETIGNSAFENCVGITDLTLGSSLSQIGENAFAGCNKITNVTVNSINPPEAPGNAFSCYNATLTLMPNAKQNYQGASADQAWPNFVTMVENTPSSIGDITGDDNQITITVNSYDGSIQLSGYDGSTPVRVYSDNGSAVYQGYNSVLPRLTPGIYIVAVANRTMKVSVR